MRCYRCCGLMIRDFFFDQLDDTGQHFFIGWRCINCGEVLDSIITSNRKKERVLLRSTRKGLVAVS